MLFVDLPENPNAIRDQQAADNEFYAAALNELVHLGLDLARTIHRQVTAQSLDSPHSPIDEHAGLAFERISRAVRRSIMLAKRLHEPAPALPAKPIRAETRQPSLQEVCDIIDRKAEQILNGKDDSGDEDAIPDEPDRPYADRPDTPDNDDPEEPFENRPFLKSIDEIRKDLGLPPLNPPTEPARFSLIQTPPIEPETRTEKPSPTGRGSGEAIRPGLPPGTNTHRPSS